MKKANFEVVVGASYISFGDNTLIHYLDADDSAIVAIAETEEFIFKFDSSCRMFNRKDNCIAVIRSSNNGEVWTFYEVDISNKERFVTNPVFTAKANYPFKAEVEFINWLIENNKFEEYRTK